MYYTNEENSDYCKICLDGTDQKTLIKGKNSNVRVTDYGIYYINADFSGPMYRIGLNGGNETLISENTISDYEIGEDEWIYYSDEDNCMRLTKMRMDGSDVQTIGKFRVSDINEYKDWLFCVSWDYSSHQKVIRVQKNGYDFRVLNETTSFIRYVKNGWVYYNDGEDFYALYRVNFNTKEIQKASDDSLVRFKIIGKWLYFVNDSKIYRSFTDGSEKVLISDVEVDTMELGKK